MAREQALARSPHLAGSTVGVFNFSRTERQYMATTNNPADTRTAATARRSAAQDIGEAGDAMKDSVRNATDKLDEARSATAGRLESVASAVQEKIEELPGGEKVRNVARAAADRLEATADYMRHHDAQRIWADIETVVKNNPGPSLAIAAAVGFLVGRALTRD
jgi:ElaB/YqjD/DUF883 family membrane-anchored ribosome-binding protein